MHAPAIPSTSDYVCDGGVGVGIQGGCLNADSNPFNRNNSVFPQEDFYFEHSQRIESRSADKPGPFHSASSPPRNYIVNLHLYSVCASPPTHNTNLLNLNTKMRNTLDQISFEPLLSSLRERRRRQQVRIELGLAKCLADTSETLFRVWFVESKHFLHFLLL